MRPALRLFAIAAALLLPACDPAGARDKAFPDPASDTADARAKEDVAVFAGGCFWGVEAVFEHVRGVKSVVSGYAGGTRLTARYPIVASGTTGHAEAVRVVYDPREVSYGQLLKVFFAVAHDPTQLNRQGPDRGTQYRSQVFATSAAQQQAARDYIARLDDAGVFKRPIVTRVEPLQAFYKAESYHQDYLRRHPDEAYIVHHDLPKLAALEREFPALWR